MRDKSLHRERLLALLLLTIATTPVAGPIQLFPATGWQMVAKTVLFGGAATLIVAGIVLWALTWGWNRVVRHRPDGPHLEDPKKLAEHHGGGPRN